MISGGWGFVGAAYISTWLVLGLYAISLWMRLRKIAEKERESR